MIVPARQRWTPTGIDLHAGDAFAATAEGTIVTNASGSTASPQGVAPDCRVAGSVHIPFEAPQLPCWSLLGRIGPKGSVFEIGNRADLVATSSGQLFLGINDNFFGDNSGNWTARVTANSPPQSIAASDCVAAGNTHGFVRIVSDTGVFAEVSGAHKILAAAPGSLLQGSVTLQVVNGGPCFAIAPLIQTSSWGNHETSWALVSPNVSSGERSFTAQVSVRAPLEPGTYHILFAFQMETNGASVASATYWARNQNVWHDGNDIADFNSSQIRHAQQFGCAIDSYLTETGMQPAYVPADAITVVIGMP